MLIDTKVHPSEIKEHLLFPFCSIIKNAVRIEDPGNSVVHCSQWFPFFELTEACFPRTLIGEIKIGVNFVDIKGEIPKNESMHVHTSMLVAIVVEGEGIMIYEKNGIELREQLNVRDMVFVPRNTLHYFEGAPRVKFSAIQFGPSIDYQKHHKSLVD